jgi:hypothetical protein
MVAKGGTAKRDGAVSQLRRGVIEFCVLALLADEERYGFELVQRLAARPPQARGRRGDDLAGVAGWAPAPLLPPDPRWEELARSVCG